MVNKQKSTKLRKTNFISPGSQVLSLGRLSFHWGDVYHELLTISWLKFFGLISLIYLVINTLFAFAYLIDCDGIENAQPGSFTDAFFFSVQTMATIGYGAMYPRTPYTHFLVTIEVFVGLLTVAMATGLLFARFSRPTARVIFSNVAVICPYNGVPTLMFRTANQRNNLIVEAQVQVSVLLPDITSEGYYFRRLHDLKLVRSQTPIFSLSWTVMHSIDKASPLWGETAKSLANSDAQIIVSLTGLDETLSQIIHARQVYLAEEVLWNMRFVDVLSKSANGDRLTAPLSDRTIDYNHFHKVIPIEKIS